ncbi:hypothetical protein ACJMK2_035304 [Sinanodonta woodiana]|uniref:Uncharacterized protein n=1 Tax=Sinanodonta woodiana TaxID=1069815 RepID=A0ABD3WXY8_SINWO
MPQSKQQEFVFHFSCKGTNSKLTVPVTIPLKQTVSDLVGRLVNAHNLPCFVEKDLSKSLEQFVTKETKVLNDENAEEAILKVKNGEIDVDKLVDSWTKAFTLEVKSFAQPEEISADQVFSEVYHTLIHSPALETLLNLEHTYAMTIGDLIHQRDQDLEYLEKRQREEMESAVQKVGIKYTDEEINRMAQQHFDNMQLIENKWASELSNQQEIQKREYRDWVLKVHEDTHTSRTPKYMQRVRTLTTNLPDAHEEERKEQVPRMEESFTIHLGAQMKTTHNIRLLCTHVLDLCKHKIHTVGGVPVAEPQRLQTAMSLYSNTLCGMIVLVDKRLNSYTGIKRGFAKVCEQSTDFHFPNLEQQFLLIKQEVVNVTEVRARKVKEEVADKISVQSGSSGSEEGQDKTMKLHTGDFYITRHSNLSEVHVVFHLIVDDTVKTDITSRHPVILSIRNIIKLCFRYDITTVSIPLLLTHEMTEEMTIPWCLKRAELIFKCVKGFMMEMASYGSQESRTLQFLVPYGISEELFANISNMLPTIFRLSNPVVVKSS